MAQTEVDADYGAGENNSHNTSQIQIQLDEQQPHSHREFTNNNTTNSSNNNNNNNKRGVAWYEVVAIGVSVCCACVIIGTVCVVPIYTKSMYDSLVERTSATLQSTAKDAAYQIGTKLKEYQTMLEMYGDAVIQARWDNVSELLPESCFSWGLFFGVSSIYYTPSSECGLGLTAYTSDHLYPGDPGYSELMLNLRNLMLGQTTYPNDLALSFMSKYSINAVASVTLEQVVRMTPWWNVSLITADKVEVFTEIQSYIGIRAPKWTPPLKDPRYNGWKTRLYIPLLRSGSAYGVAVLQVDPSYIIDYVELVSTLMPYKGYSLIVSSTGSILAIPEKGWKDWSLGIVDFNFTEEMDKDSFDPGFWNIFNNPAFAQVGIPVNESISSSNSTTLACGTSTVSLNKGETIISWNQIETANWVVIAVLNKDDALSAQETALVKVIVLSSIMGCVVLIVSISTAIYMAVKKQYSHLSNKVADLHLKLEEAEHKISQLTTTADEVTVTALTSGLDKVTTLIARLVDNPGRGIDAEDVDTLKLTQMLLMTRNFTTVKLETDLTENQHQFILDCGMQVDEKNVFGKARGTHSRSALRSQARSTNTSLSDFSKSMEEAELPSNMDDDIPSINDWSFDVFSLEDKLAAHGGNILGAVGYKILSEQWLLPQFHPTVKLDIPNFFGFTSQLKRGYSRHPNPYHNFLHAADVTQAMNVLLQMATQSSEEFASCLSPLDKIACVLAALSHDYRHPGLNSNFLKSTMDAIYVKYGDSVLERMHAATALKVLFFRNKCCALRALSPDDQHYIHTVMMSLILATDMAKHIDILETMKSFGVGTRTTTAALFSADPGQAKSAKFLVLQVLMKIADLSNVCRDWPVCKKWTYNLVEEFKGQGEQEKRHGIPTSKFMDGSTTPQEMQNTFIPLIVIPLLKAISGIFPNFQVLEQRAWENLERWRTMASTSTGANASATADNGSGTAPSHNYGGSVHCFVVGDAAAASSLFRILLPYNGPPSSPPAPTPKTEPWNNPALLRALVNPGHPLRSQPTAPMETDKDGVPNDLTLGPTGGPRPHVTGHSNCRTADAGGGAAAAASTSTSSPVLQLHRRGSPGWVRATGGPGGGLGPGQVGVAVVVVKGDFGDMGANARNKLVCKEVVGGVTGLWPTRGVQQYTGEAYPLVVVVVDDYKGNYGLRSEAACIALSLSLCAYSLLKYTPQCMSQFVGEFISSLIDISRKTGFCEYTITREWTFQDMREFLFPGETVAMAIGEMPQACARTLLQLLMPQDSSHKRDSSDSPPTTTATALRTWVIMGNWAAVREVCLTDALKDEDVNLSSLHLNSVPEDIKGLSCATLLLNRNKLNGFPQWLPDSAITNVVFDENPLSTIPFDIKRKTIDSWLTMKHFVKFGQRPVRSRFHKLLLVGETTSGKASLLKCLMGKKSKVSSPSEKEFHSSCIAMQTKPFKFYKKSKNTWTVWNLGPWHQFYPCFFVSDSIFLFVFDILCKTALPQIQSWLKQLVKFQKQKSGHTKQSAGATVILIGTYTNAPEEAGTFLREFFTSITSNPISKDFIFDGFFGINLHRGIGLTFNSRSLDWEMTGKPFEEIAFLLEEIGSEEPTYVSQSWINLNTELDRIKESEISWNKFVAIARRCGVGKTWGNNQQKELREIESCCNYLADIGTLIHFRHPFFSGELPLFSCSQKGSFMLSNIIVLKFDWFSRIQKSIDAAITDCRDILLSVENHPMWRYCNQVWDSHRIVPLLLKLQAMVVLRENMRFSFSLLPVEPPPENALEIRGFWGEFDNTGKQVIFSGRSIKCEYFPVESFSEVMTMLWNLPCAVPCWFWREGLLLRAKKDPFENYLLISHKDNETIDICMLSTFSEDVKPSWSNNLMIPVLNLLHHCTSFTEIFTETKFCCPHCLLVYSKLFAAHGSAARVAPVCMPPDITNFTYNEVLAAAVGGLKCLQCKKNKPDPVPVELTGIIPELYATPFPVRGDSSIQYFTALVKYLAIPEHPRVMKFFTPGVPFPELPCPITPHHLNDIQGFTWAQFRKNPVLGDLLNMCTTDRTSPHLLEQVLPMKLREKILKDVAFGLEHLHKQIPPITHGDICVENVIISSLDDSGPEPWAKIVLNCSKEDLPAKGKNKEISRAPEFVSGSTLSTQDDIWNFGILVHQLVYPFESSIELMRLQPNPLPYTQQPTSNNNNNQLPITTAAHTDGAPKQQLEPHGIRDSDVIMVERHQLGKALATGAYTLPPFQFMHSQKNSGENPAPSTATASHHSDVHVPPWAIQIMTCCWSIDPQTRPPISSILNVWAHFDNSYSPP